MPVRADDLEFAITVRCHVEAAITELVEVPVLVVCERIRQFGLAMPSKLIAKNRESTPTVLPANVRHSLDRLQPHPLPYRCQIADAFQTMASAAAVIGD